MTNHEIRMSNQTSAFSVNSRALRASVVKSLSRCQSNFDIRQSSSPDQDGHERLCGSPLPTIFMRFLPFLLFSSLPCG